MGRKRNQKMGGKKTRSMFIMLYSVVKHLLFPFLVTETLSVGVAVTLL